MLVTKPKEESGGNHVGTRDRISLIHTHNVPKAMKQNRLTVVANLHLKHVVILVRMYTGPYSYQDYHIRYFKCPAAHLLKRRSP